MNKEQALQWLQEEIKDVTTSGYDHHDTLFTADEVEECLGYLYDETEGYGAYDLVAIVRLKDGRFGYYAAWADTTGHGCQCDVQTAVEPTLGEVLKYHFTYGEQRQILDTFEVRE